MPFEAPVTNATFPLRVLIICSRCRKRYRFDVSTTIELIARPSKRIQVRCEYILKTWRSLFCAGLCLEGGNRGSQGLENAGAKAQEVELTLAAGVNDACGFQLLDVVRKRGRRYRYRLKCLRATHRALRACNALQQFKSPRICKSLQDCGPSRPAQASWFRDLRFVIH